MELNKNERKINKEVLEILTKQQPEEAFEGTIKEGSPLKYIVVNTRDIRLYANDETRDDFLAKLNYLAEEIEEGRVAADKKPFNNYIVVNIDEPYINDIVAVLEDNGHWDGKPSTTPNIVDYSNKVRSKMLNVILKLQKAEHKVFELDDPIERPIGVLISEALHELHQIHDYFEPGEKC